MCKAFYICLSDLRKKRRRNLRKGEFILLLRKFKCFCCSALSRSKRFYVFVSSVLLFLLQQLRHRINVSWWIPPKCGRVVCLFIFHRTRMILITLNEIKYYLHRQLYFHAVIYTWWHFVLSFHTPSPKLLFFFLKMSVALSKRRELYIWHSVTLQHVCTQL